MITQICNPRHSVVSIFVYIKKGESYSIVFYGDRLVETDTSYELYEKDSYIARIYKSTRNKIIVTE